MHADAHRPGCADLSSSPNQRTGADQRTGTNQRARTNGCALTDCTTGANSAPSGNRRRADPDARLRWELGSQGRARIRHSRDGAYWQVPGKDS